MKRSLTALALVLLTQSGTGAIVSGSFTHHDGQTMPIFGPDAVDTVVDDRSTTEVDADGFTVDRTYLDARSESTSRPSTDRGGGTSTTTSNRKYEGTTRSRLIENADLFSFDRSHSFTATFDNRTSFSTYGNFFIISTPNFTVTNSPLRILDIAATEVLSLSMRLDGGSSNGDFRDMLSNIVLYGDGIADRYFWIHTTTYSTDTGVTNFDGSRVGNSAAVVVTGSGDSSGIQLDMTITPLHEDQPAELRLTWAAEEDSTIEFGPYIRNGTYTDHGESSYFFNESLTITPIPEPSSAILLVLGGLAVARRRPRPLRKEAYHWNC